MIPDSEISKCPEFETKSKIGKIFKNHNFLEEYYIDNVKHEKYTIKNKSYRNWKRI